MFEGALFIVLGILIRFFKWSWLILGYNTASKEEKAKYDRTALCNFVGNLLFTLAVIMILGAFGESFHLIWVSIVKWALFVVAIISALIYMNTGNRFKKLA